MAMGLVPVGDGRSGAVVATGLAQSRGERHKTTQRL
jgi:hypothetical protein